MSISEELGLYSLSWKMEKTRPLRAEMDGEVLIFRRSQHFLFIVKIQKVFFTICTLTLCVNNYVYPQRTGVKSRNESTNS